MSDGRAIRLGQWEDEGAWLEFSVNGAVDPEPPPSFFEEEFILPGGPGAGEGPEIVAASWREPPDEPERPPPQDLIEVGRGDRWWEDPGDVSGAITEYLAKAGGSFAGALAQIEDERSRQPDNLVLRDAEHALITQQAIETFGPLGAVMGLVAVPAYSAAKWIAQSVPEVVGQLIDAVSPIQLRGPGVTPPSWREMRGGLWRW